MRQRRPKQRHNPITHDLIDRAFIAMDGGHHPLQHRVEELAGLLRVAVGQQFHRALQIGEQHGDLLALPFECATRGEDFFRQIRGRVGQRRGGLAGLGCWHAYGGRRRGGGGGNGARPDQPATIVHDHVGVRVEERLFRDPPGRPRRGRIGASGPDTRGAGRAGATPGPEPACL